MLKRLTLLSLFLIGTSLSNSLLASTKEEAYNLSLARDYTSEGLENAAKASNMYEELAASTTDELEKIELLLGVSSMQYFLGDAATSSDEKIKLFLKAKDIALKAASYLELQPGKVKDEDNSELLARAYYWFGASLGRWGEANGVLSSLGQWPTLQKYLGYIKDLGEEQVESFGANRVLGRIYYKLPFPLGSNRTSLNYLQEANDKSAPSPSDISSHSLNVIFYAETLIAIGGNDNKRLAREILEKLIKKGESLETLKEYNFERIAESKKDIEEAKKILKNL